MPNRLAAYLRGGMLGPAYRGKHRWRAAKQRSADPTSAPTCQKSGRARLWNGYLATPTAPGPDPMPPTLDEGVVLAVAEVELPPVTVPESV